MTSKAKTLASTVSTGGPLADGAIDVAEVTGLQTALDAKQATLESGTNIKTLNGQSVLGSGDLAIEGFTLAQAQATSLSF
jgi:hypothetical protein